ILWAMESLPEAEGKTRLDRVLGILSGVLLPVVGWILWFGILPLAFGRWVRSARRACAAGFLAGVAFFYIAIWWVHHAMTAFGGMPFGLAFLGLSLLVFWMAAHWGLAFALSAYLRRRLGWPWWRHLPLTWAAAELL